MTYGTYGRDAFIDPAPGGLGTYEFQVGHSDEDEFGNGRAIAVTSNTLGEVAVRQQGDEEPMVLTLRGTILHRNQHEVFVMFYRKSAVNTIIFRDFYGEEFEGVIQSYKSQRKRTLRNPRDPSISRHYYTYVIVFHVVKVKTGAFA